MQMEEKVNDTRAPLLTKTRSSRPPLAADSLPTAKSRRIRLDSFPAGLLVLVIPGIDVLAAGYSIASKFRITIIAQFKIPDHPSRSWIHISLQLHHLLRQALRQSIQGTIRTLITTLHTRIRFNCIEGTIRPVHRIMIITEERTRRLNRRERHSNPGRQENIVRALAAQVGNSTRSNPTSKDLFDLHIRYSCSRSGLDVDQRIDLPDTNIVQGQSQGIGLVRFYISDSFLNTRNPS